MPAFEITFIGREIGAIGIFQRFTLTVDANSFSEATRRLYETHEHISNVRLCTA